MTTKPIIVWFRQDLRRSDNPALYAAYEKGAPVLPIYILDDDNAGEWKMGGAARWWRHHALQSLNDSLSGHLHYFKGKADEILPKLIEDTGAQAVYWNRCYEPWRIERDKKIKSALRCDVESFNGSLLWEPWNKEIMKDDGTPYKVFTPFYRKGCLKAAPPREPLPAPERLTYAEDVESRLSLDDLQLLPHKSEPRWDKQLEPHWDISEDGAQKRLKDFLEDGISDYKEGRNFPAKDHVSRLSPYLHHGLISPHQVWYAALSTNDPHDKNTDHFLSELGWREFSYSLLYHNPDLPRKNLQQKFDKFPWHTDDKALLRWQTGQTGYPIVDAAMRELWQTGYMHNRPRMIVGSFLVKHLRLHWHHGEEWFWDCLCDADLANNSASWQWIAGCGADAAPYFRIFNPITQGSKFDPEGEYVRKYVPELYNLPNKYLFSPWEAPADVLRDAGVKLGETYPEPLVDHQKAREAALEAFEQTK